jgi:hypothetical protein
MRILNPAAVLLTTGSIFIFIIIAPLAAQVVQYEITDSSGRDIPAKITFLTREGKVPAKVGIRSKVPEYAARKNVVYELYGRGEIPLPAGRYRAWVSHGLEWSIAVVDLEVAADRPTALKARLDRVVDTTGYISGDFHLHTRTFSGHGDANVEERLITLCAENLEWAVATDHNHITDYRPYAHRIGADRWIKTSIGDEVTTSTIGHFNTFPIDPKQKPANHRTGDGRELFKRIRQNPLEEILQVNHPRWTGDGGGYFRELDLSTLAGDSANPKFSFDFDSLEILNDNSLGGWELRPLPIKQDPDFDRSVREDWFNLLNRGIRPTGVGNSDSHYVEEAIGGCPRNFVVSPTDDPTAAREADLVQAIRAHQVVVSGGIFVTMKAEGKFLPGATVPARDGGVDLEIKVQAAPWVDVRRVVVIANGEPVFRRDLPPDPLPAAPPGKFARLQASALPGPATSAVEEQPSSGEKKAAAPAAPEPELAIPPARPVVRFNDTIRLKTAVDTWFIAYAEGDLPPYPMLHKVTVPLGFTNPIWVDADRNGKLTSVRDLASAAIVPTRGARLQSGELARRLSPASPAFKRQVAAAISASTAPDRAGSLSELLKDHEASVREGAAMAIAGLGDRPAIAALLEARDHAPTPWERFVLDRELVRGGELAALADIVKVKTDFKDFDALCAQRDLKELCRKNRIERWWTIGPFPAKDVEDGLAKAYPPEKEIKYRRSYDGFEKKTVSWKRLGTDQGHSLSFGSLSPKENAVAYAQVLVRARAPFKTGLLLGAKCGLDIRLNGHSVHKQKKADKGSAATQIIPVEFPAGESSLLVKAAVAKGDFGFSLMVVDPRGDLKIEAPKLPDLPAKKF